MELRRDGSEVGFCEFFVERGVSRFLVVKGFYIFVKLFKGVY